MLIWAGENPLGTVCALLLVYLVAGSIAGSALATKDEINCWPQATFSMVYAPCDNEQVRQAWFFAVGFPNTMLQGPVTALTLATSGQGGYFGVIDTVTIVLTPFLAFFGFAGWYRWAPPVAWLLLLALIGEIVYLRMQLPA